MTEEVSLGKKVREITIAEQIVRTLYRVFQLMLAAILEKLLLSTFYRKVRFGF